MCSSNISNTMMYPNTLPNPMVCPLTTPNTMVYDSTISNKHHGVPLTFQTLVCVSLPSQALCHVAIHSAKLGEESISGIFYCKHNHSHKTSSPLIPRPRITSVPQSQPVSPYKRRLFLLPELIRVKRELYSESLSAVVSSLSLSASAISS